MVAVLDLYFEEIKVTEIKSVINLGLVGYGFIAKKHIRAFQGVAGTRVVLSAVCDKNEKIEGVVKKEFGDVGFYSDLETMLNSQKFDVVYVSTPPATHAGLSVLCMKRGCDVVVEKPMATSLAECDSMIDAMKENDARIFVLHTSLFNPAFLRLKDMIARGEVGEVFGVDVNYFGNSEEYFIVDPNHWSHSLPCGAFCESLPHPLYLLQSLIPKLDVEAVYWQKHGALKHLKADDLCVLLKGDSASATLRMGWNSPRNMAMIRVYGTKALVDCDVHGLCVVKHGRGTVEPLSVGADSLQTSLSLFKGSVTNAYRWAIEGWRGGYQTIIPKIVQSIAENRPSPVNVEDAREVVRLMENVCLQISP